MYDYALGIVVGGIGVGILVALLAHFRPQVFVSMSTLIAIADAHLYPFVPSRGTKGSTGPRGLEGNTGPTGPPVLVSVEVVNK
jgi:hypothetical protein